MLHRGLNLNVIIGIDDTDNIDSENGTGRLVSALTEELKKTGNVLFSGVVRHQLYQHPSIPYTSHNSAMSVLAEVEPGYMEWLIEALPELLVRDSAEGSDPGFCIAETDKIKKPEKLIEYGQRAKKEVLNKIIAYNLAESLNMHLSEHGGTGDGIVGALAAVGLRLSGNDGRFRGKYKLGKADDIITVKELLKQTAIESVQDLNGLALAEDELIRLGERVKGVLIDNKKILLVTPVNHNIKKCTWQSCPMDYLRKFY